MILFLFQFKNRVIWFSYRNYMREVRERRSCVSTVQKYVASVETVSELIQISTEPLQPPLRKISYSHSCATED